MIPIERSASVKFFEQVLRPEKDKAFIIHFDHEIELLEDLTSSREQLEKALDQLHAREPQRNIGNDPNNPSDGGNGGGQSRGGGWPGGGGGGGGWPGGGGGMGWPGGGGGHRGGGNRQGGNHVHMGGTAFYDAIYLASDEIMKKQSGRKALIMLTDGDDNASKTSLGDAITSAQRADTLGYSIRVVDEEIGSMVRGFGGGAPDHKEGKKILQQISNRLAAVFLKQQKKKPLRYIYSQIEEELRNQYSIGYSSYKAAGDMGYRKIDLSVNKKWRCKPAKDISHKAGSDIRVKMKPLVLAFFAAILLDAQQPLAVHAVDNRAKLPDGWNFGECSGVAVDKSDNVWIFNCGLHPLMKFDKDGNFLKSISEVPVASAHGIRVGPDGNLWLVDVAGHKLLEMSTEGRILLVIGNVGNAPGDNESTEAFNRPTNIAFARRLLLCVRWLR